MPQVPACRTDVVSKFSVVALQYQQMLEQLRPILKHNAVFPKVRHPGPRSLPYWFWHLEARGKGQGLYVMQAVNEHNAARLPLLLSTKLLPGMEAEEEQMLQAHAAAFKGQELAVQISELTVSPWWWQLCGMREALLARIAHRPACALVTVQVLALDHTMPHSWPAATCRAIMGGLRLTRLSAGAERTSQRCGQELNEG